jgi:hypothetical protein
MLGQTNSWVDIDKMIPVPTPCALTEVSRLIGRAEELLREAEAAWPQVLVIATSIVERLETDALEDLLRVATLETARRQPRHGVPARSVQPSRSALLSVTVWGASQRLLPAPAGSRPVPGKPLRSLC